MKFLVIIDAYARDQANQYWKVELALTYHPRRADNLHSLAVNDRSVF